MTNPIRPDDSKFAPASAPLVQGVADTGAFGDRITHTAALSHTVPSYPPGTTWSDLRIMNELGRGGYGCVYRAWDNLLAREVALKIIRLQQSDPASIAAVVQEGQMLAKVRHRNVVTIYGASQVGDEFGLWMELVRGRSLSHMVYNDGPLGAEEASVIGLSLCDALAAVHAAGLLHRDVKAQNVMRESGGRIVLMDFGAGRELALGQAGMGDMIGTPSYMAPEVLAGGAWTPAADVYSVGVLLFFLVTGKHPVEGRTLADIALAHALGHQRLLVDCRPGLPEGFVRVIERALACRYRTAGALMKELAEAVTGGAGSWGDGALPLERDSPMLATPVMANAPTDTGSGIAAPARLSIPQWVAIAASSMFGVWLIGFLTSVAFDQSLGRAATGFSDDSVLGYFGWGVKALFPLSSYMLLALIVACVVWGIARLIGRVIPPVAWVTGAVRERMANGARIAGLTNRSTRAQWLLAGQLVAVAILYWCFRDFIDAFGSFLDTAPPAALAQLRPDNDTQLFYRLVLAVVVFAMGLAWWRLLKSSPGEPPIDRLTPAAGLAVTFIVLIMATVPFRLVHHRSTFQRADYAGKRCYITGQRESDLLLFCPDAPPRTRIVSVPAGEPTLRRMNRLESIFSPASSPGR